MDIKKILENKNIRGAVLREVDAPLDDLAARLDSAKIKLTEKFDEYKAELDSSLNNMFEGKGNTKRIYETVMGYVSDIIRISELNMSMENYLSKLQHTHDEELESDIRNDAEDLLKNVDKE